MGSLPPSGGLLMDTTKLKNDVNGMKVSADGVGREIQVGLDDARRLEAEANAVRKRNQDASEIVF